MNEETIVIEEPIVEDVVEDTQEPDQEVIEEKEPEHEKVPKGVQKRIDEITREKYEERRERQAAQERVAKLERELEALKVGATPTAKQTREGAPNPDDYDAGKYDPDYLEALTDYKVNQMFALQQEQSKIAAKQSNVITLQEQARAVHEDYDQAEQSFLSHPLTTVPAFNNLLLETDNPAEIAYYLGKNPEEMEHLGQLTPTQALRYLGKIEALIDKSLEPPKKAVTNAPKPITPLSGAKGSSGVKSPEDMTQDEYVRWRQAQKR